MSIKLSTEKFSITDYKVSADLLKNYSQMRLIALGGAISLIAAIMSISVDNNFFSILTKNIILILSVYISIRIIGSINANVYARCLHLEWIERTEKELGFFIYWNKFVLDKSENASSNAFLMACIGFNVGGFLSSIYSIISSLQYTGALTIINNLPIFNIELKSHLHLIEFTVSLIYLLLSLLVMLLNNHYIRVNMVTHNLIPRLEKELTETRNSVILNRPIVVHERDSDLNSQEKNNIIRTAIVIPTNHDKN